MSTIAIIVPCYNEASRLQPNSFIEFANSHPSIQFYFVNDGSTDKTTETLLQIQQSCLRTKIISLEKNNGKGEAIRQGLTEALKENHDLIGYLDADLSTSLEEFLRLAIIAQEQKIDLLLGSRIKKMDSVIERSAFRHLAGRILATIINNKLRLEIYDTQCGAKLFKPYLLEKIIEQPFCTKWFFDVELLMRIKQKNFVYTATEVPLKKWRSMPNSKLSIFSFPSVIKELYILLNKY